MKIAIDPGHNCLCSNKKHDLGATGLAQEDDLTLELAELITARLEKLGHKVINCLPEHADNVNDSLRQRVNIANAANVDIFVSLHFNAFPTQKAHGSEIYAVSTTGRGIGSEVLREISDLGFRNRGVKKANFYVLKYTQMPAILIECCFIDNPRDMNVYDAEKMADAIVKGLVGELPPNFGANPAKLIVRDKTWLKPSTEQSSKIPEDKLREILPGRYDVDFVTEEEGHYLVNFEGFDYFIYCGHCQIG